VLVVNDVFAGTYPLGTFSNEYIYDVDVESIIDATSCNANETGTLDCFTCDLEVVNTERCDGLTGFFVDIAITGTGTFTLDDGTNPPLTGLTAGNETFGPFNNGDSYSYTITSEIEAEGCSETVSGSLDCFECDLSSFATTDCIDKLTYDVNVNITGTGSFIIDDGINPPLTGQTAGTIPLTNVYNNDDVYEIIITSELNPTCTDTLTGTNYCFECDLNAFVTPVCSEDLNTYTIEIALTGSGTFTVTNGADVLSNESAGTVVLGPYPSEAAYNIVIASNIDETCTRNFIGSKDCFDCDLTIDANFVCSEEEDDYTYMVSYTIGGSGTYTVDDGLNALQTGIPAGTYIAGPFQSGEDYEIIITSEVDPECTETAYNTASCYECELNPIVETECTDDLTGYFVNVDLNGAIGTFTLNGLGGDQTGQSGIVQFGPYDNNQN